MNSTYCELGANPLPDRVNGWPTPAVLREQDAAVPPPPLGFGSRAATASAEAIKPLAARASEMASAWPRNDMARFFKTCTSGLNSALQPAINRTAQPAVPFP